MPVTAPMSIPHRHCSTRSPSVANKGTIAGLTVAICGDILHSRVARSNMILLAAMGARVRLVAPSTLLPAGIEHLGFETFTRMEEGLRGADIVDDAAASARAHERLLRAQREGVFPLFRAGSGEALPRCPGCAGHASRPDEPGGVEIASEVADGAQSLIKEQVEMGVAVRIAVLEALAMHLPDP